MLPGIGPAWTGAMRMYPHTAVLAPMLHDESEGRVTVENGRPVIEYELNASDREQMARGLRACAEILLAAGAQYVLIPFAPPMRVSRAAELASITADVIVPHAMPLTAVHPMSAMRAGVDPTRTVCNPRGEVHSVGGLYVADGGVFPTSLGGPPQISIYTTGLRIGRNVAEDLRRT
jgi:choline dehydrogenase-like flavoprotein